MPNFSVQEKKGFNKKFKKLYKIDLFNKNGSMTKSFTQQPLDDN